MNLKRPDLSSSGPEIIAYIEALEAEVQRLRGEKTRPTAVSIEPDEPPTTLNVITISHNGLIKRTPRHHYGRQRRGGMGVFDLEVTAPDVPDVLAVVDENEHAVLITNLGRAFRLPVHTVTGSPVRARGEPLANHISFHPNEHVVAVLPDNGGNYAILVSERGWVQRVMASHFGKSLIPGMKFHDVKQGGQVTAACWTQGNQEIFMATRLGQGIRFRETQIPARGGGLGLRVGQGDVVAAVTAVTEQSSVFVVSNDGKGTIRQMSGFRLNKAPGAGGKLVIKTEELVGAVTVSEDADIFLVSQTGKIIRFQAAEVPPKEGVVQGVNCMALRNDVVTAVAASQ